MRRTKGRKIPTYKISESDTNSHLTNSSHGEPPSPPQKLRVFSHFLSGEGLTVHKLEFLGVRFFSRVKDKVDRGGCFAVVKLIGQLSRCSNILTFSRISNRYLREFWTTLHPARMAFPSIVFREILIEYQSNFNTQSEGRKISQGAKEK